MTRHRARVTEFRHEMQHEGTSHSIVNIGSQLCEGLFADGNEVICVDNLFTAGKRKTYPLRDNSKFEFLRHDITLPLSVGCRWDLQPSSARSPVHYQFDAVQTTNRSVVGAVNMQGLAKRLKVPTLKAFTIDAIVERAAPFDSFSGLVNSGNLREFSSYELVD